ncbi:chemotaxis protein CheA [Bacillus mexicanus]|uniref:chemotaxis protein CheW n=1 Tax=Bacillus mexicanus TaxID=2834415 RepID=UPI003D1D3363
MDTNEYLDMFLEESEDHLREMSDQMMKFEQEPNNLEIVAVMFRAAHTLKGMAGTMGFERTQKLTHTIENMMDAIRNGEVEPTQETIDFMFKGIDKLEVLINEIKDTGAEVSGIDDLVNVEVKTSSQKNQNEKEIVLSSLEKDAVVVAKESNQNVFQIKFELREDCLLKAVRVHMFFKEMNNLGEIIKTDTEEEELEKEEFSGILNLIFVTNEQKETIEDLINKLSEVKEITVTEWKDNDERKEDNNQNSKDADNKEENTENTKTESQTSPKKESTQDSHKKQSQSIRVNLDKIEYLMGLFEEFIVEKGRLQNIDKRMKDPELSESFERLSRVSTEMQTSLLSMRMIPLDTIFNRFPRMVRSTSKDLGKNIKFIIEGAETELDRTVVEELGDPLVHLLRNSLDHGVEMPEVRKERGKSEQGTILLKAYHRGNEAVIEIKDDGNGINVEKIKQKILKENSLTEKEIELLTEDQIIQYIFSSGMSTAEKITNLSGRGVGLDVVKTKIESLGGSVRVETKEGVGTTFVIVLPLTLSIIQALLVKESNQTFAVPLSNVVETISVQEEQIKELMGRKVLYYREEILNTHRYGELFGYSEPTGNLYALIIQNSYQRYALLVSDIVGQQEIVLKPLQGYTQNSKGVTGATVLGDGSVSFVFDVNIFQK